nr:MAG TPA: Double zinc ribbon protein [Caudoviricetes sp.]
MPQKGTSTLRMRVCRQCGIEFMGGPRAWYCPACRMERQKEQARRCRQRTLKGQTRRLGSVDKCEVCGKDYIVNSARQRYCPECAPDRIREVDRKNSTSMSNGWKRTLNATTTAATLNGTSAPRMLRRTITKSSPLM